MQEVNSNTILGNFDDHKVTIDNIDYHFILLVYECFTNDTKIKLNNLSVTYEIFLILLDIRIATLIN